MSHRTILQHLDKWQSRWYLPLVAIILLTTVRITVWSTTDRLGRREGAEMAEIAARIVQGSGFSCPYGPPNNSPTTVEPPPLRLAYRRHLLPVRNR